MPLENTPRGAARRDAANSGSHMHSETRLCVTSSRGATRLVAGRRRGGQSIRAGSSRRTPEKRGGATKTALESTSRLTARHRTRILANICSPDRAPSQLLRAEPRD